MRATLRLDNEIYREAKARASALGLSLSRFVEDSIREHLESSATLRRRRRLRLPVSTATGGLRPVFSTMEEAVTVSDAAADRRSVR